MAEMSQQFLDNYGLVVGGLLIAVVALAGGGIWLIRWVLNTLASSKAVAPAPAAPNGQLGRIEEMVRGQGAALEQHRNEVNKATDTLQGESVLARERDAEIVRLINDGNAVLTGKVDEVHKRVDGVADVTAKISERVARVETRQDSWDGLEDRRSNRARAKG